MKPLDHFPLYPEKFLSSFDVKMMSIDEFGAFCMILFASWKPENPPYIEFNEENLMRLCNCNQEQWDKIKVAVLKKFKQEGIFIYNETLLAIWKHESKEKKTKKKVDLVLLTSKLNYTFQAWWEHYDKKVGSAERLIPKWLKLTDEEREAIRAHTVLYVEAKPEKQFRVNPEKYLKERVWEQEIITFKKNTFVKKENSKIFDYDSERREKI